MMLSLNRIPVVGSIESCTERYGFADTRLTRPQLVRFSLPPLHIAPMVRWQVMPSLQTQVLIWLVIRGSSLAVMHVLRLMPQLSIPDFLSAVRFRAVLILWDDVFVSDVTEGYNANVTAEAAASAVSSLTTQVINIGNTVDAQSQQITTLNSSMNGFMTMGNNPVNNPSFDIALAPWTTAGTGAGVTWGAAMGDGGQVLRADQAGKWSEHGHSGQRCQVAAD
ncbi:hypothetical protein [Stenotrophomonas phage CM2]